YLQKLKEEIRPIFCLRAVAELLSWDQETYMPKGAAQARAEQSATISKLSHSLLCSPAMGELIEKAQAEIEDPNSEDGHLLRLIRTEYERERKVPSELVSKLSEACSKAQNAWVEARAQGKFALMQNEIADVISYTRECAEYYGYKDHIYDAMLDYYEPGTTVAQLDKVFTELRPHLVSLVSRIKNAPLPEHTLWKQKYPIKNQRIFANNISSAMGYNWDYGRTDDVIHPFCASFSTRDVRITNTYKEFEPTRSLFTALHETGHALYEQGSPESWRHTPLEGGTSMGWHESMSRLWENVIGRSLPFWEYFFPRYKDLFSEQLESCDLPLFYRAVNEVTPSFVRTEADEVTYNLHIMLRYELEKELLSGALQVKDIPEAWNESMKAYLGIVPSNDKEGCAQDVHWPLGLIGYFPSYALGNIRSAQVWETLKADIPDIDSELRRGNLLIIRDWLAKHIFCWGRRLLPNELQQQVVGKELCADAFISYLETKYSTIYKI
ncbi:carboxypeptidase M32, partial [bacterium]|nr:carboxypeptidase M32 [bacterium]